MKPDSISYHHIVMSRDDIEKIKAGTHEICGIAGEKVILKPVDSDDETTPEVWR